MQNRQNSKDSVIVKRQQVQRPALISDCYQLSALGV